MKHAKKLLLLSFFMYSYPLQCNILTAMRLISLFIGTKPTRAIASSEPILFNLYPGELVLYKGHYAIIQKQAENNTYNIITRIYPHTIIKSNINSIQTLAPRAYLRDNNIGAALGISPSTP